MFGAGAPVKHPKETTPQPTPPTNTQSVKHNIEESETNIPSTNSTSPKKAAHTAPTQTNQASTSIQPETKTVNRKGSCGTDNLNKNATSTDRVAEAKAILLKAKHHLGEARNLKTDIKVEVTKCIEKFYSIIKEIETGKKGNMRQNGKETEMEIEESQQPVTEKIHETNSLILEKLEENNRIVIENSKKLEELKQELERQTEKIGNTTYATITAGQPKNPPEKALHSIIVSSKDEDETGEEILNKVREAVNAKEGWVRVEKVRKAKGKKVIMSCKTQEEKNKVKNRIENSNKNLSVEEARNKDPLLIIRDVLTYNSDEDILAAITNQNKDLFKNLKKEDTRTQIKYKIKTRNHNTSHIVISTSPALWKTAIEAGSLHIDLQRVRVSDQSPLVQCTRCLGYGHGKRFCKESADACSHCGEPHLSVECPKKTAGTTPTCINCTQTKMSNVGHNAFSAECPVRQKWDAIARSTVAYC